MVTAKISVQSAFESLLDAIKPTADERAQASKSQNHVREVLRNAEARNEIPWLLDNKEFLSGSFIRHTGASNRYATSFGTLSATPTKMECV